MEIMGIVEKHLYVKEHPQQAISSMERDHTLSPTSPQVMMIAVMTVMHIPYDLCHLKLPNLNPIRLQPMNA